MTDIAPSDPLAEALAEVQNTPDKSVMGRGLMIIEALSRAGRPLSLATLAKVTQLPKSTVHRMASQLADLGLLDRTETGFSLGLRVFEWGSQAARQRDLRRVAIPFLSDLYTRLRETIHLGVLDGRDVVYVEKLEGHTAVRCPTTVGGRRPAHSTALGKAMLAFTPGGIEAVCRQPLPLQTSHTVIAPGLLYRQLLKVRETHVSIEIEEAFVGVACVAAPILYPDGTAAGAVSITSPALRFQPRHTAPVARETARRISAKLAEVVAERRDAELSTGEHH
ncbi:IclR family transcriptional regulator [Micromonospora radicis]|nr:IclR family transcriptional regulator [Micromonospora radicis]